jgi:hypothetical protein
MAKGWESKSVEAQQEAKETEVPSGARRQMTPAEAENHRKKQNLLLSRAQVVRSMEQSESPRYRGMLEKALADLDSQIAKLT